MNIIEYTGTQKSTVDFNGRNYIGNTYFFPWDKKCVENNQAKLLGYMSNWSILIVPKTHTTEQPTFGTANQKGTGHFNLTPEANDQTRDWTIHSLID